MSDKTTVANIRDGIPLEGITYIGRAGRGFDGYFGNPFQIGRDGTRDEVLAKYTRYFNDRIARDPDFRERVHALSGLTLLCFCKPLACHGDVIAAYLNAQENPS